MTQPEPTGTVVDGVDIDAVHAAVSGCSGVVRVGGGSLAALTTYLPGRRVPGIRINSDSIEIEVVAAWGSRTVEIGASIRRAVRRVTVGRVVDVTIADIELPDELPVESVEPARHSASASRAAPAPRELAATTVHPPAIPSGK